MATTRFKDKTRKRYLLYKQGLTDAELARKCNVTRSTIRLWRYYHCLPRNIKFTNEIKMKAVNYYKNGMTVKNILNICKISQSSLYNWLAENNIPKQIPYRKHNSYTRKLLTGRNLHHLRKKGITDKALYRYALDHDIEHENVELYIGIWLQYLCRQNDKCPTKALLPETNIDTLTIKSRGETK